MFEAFIYFSQKSIDNNNEENKIMKKKLVAIKIQ